jgi:hypothetical protein
MEISIIYLHRNCCKVLTTLRNLFSPSQKEVQKDESNVSLSSTSYTQLFRFLYQKMSIPQNSYIQKKSYATTVKPKNKVDE